ncbi:hypothetical protein [Gimesia chilikensis]|uniref:Uncharacterized protein n=1 Tax=Gimesia chilikensis TaxID=2605989 RepID=A0A517PMC9_9PLAN|nr:hypothetical protein [Gimesia chilikensis]QDT20523.1 hypothetical protein HG66A1_23090 [Gimesia chilikensis]
MCPQQTGATVGSSDSAWVQTTAGRRAHLKNHEARAKGLTSGDAQERCDSRLARSSEARRDTFHDAREPSPKIISSEYFKIVNSDILNFQKIGNLRVDMNILVHICFFNSFFWRYRDGQIYF